ncbi:hypothetical protein [Croceicoccus hydrothermalis]|uniref:hypothetical protein n=1 Tax=Croceicoccus hydrothermalis TaxID=2867964 RepID=UPI001EFBD135|nr:hypothetical protein [Croceicoccus hydrothermalis]
MKITPYFWTASAVAVLTSTVLAQGAAEQASAPSPQRAMAASSPSQMEGSVSRFIALSELGLGEGFEMDGLSGTRELYFPIPAGLDVGDMRLRLPYRSNAAFDSRRAVAIEIGGRTRFVTALSDGYSEGVIDIPLTPDMIEGGFLAARIVYSGAITEDRCVDQRVSGAYLAFDGTGGLSASFGRGGLSDIGVLAAAMPRAVNIVLPPDPRPAEAAAALSLLLGLPDARLAGGPDAVATGNAGWSNGTVRIARGNGPALAVVDGSDGPALQIGGDDPVAAVRFLRAEGRTLAATPAATIAARRATGAAQTLTIADLGADTTVRSFADSAEWGVSIPASAIPAGERMTGAELDVAVANDGGATAPVITVTMNGVLLASMTAAMDEPTRIPVTFPEGIAASRNRLEVRVTRQTAGGDCRFAPQGYPAQLLPSSRIVTGPTGEPVDFSDLPSAFNAGFTAVLRGPRDLAPVAALLGPLVNAGADIAVTYGDVPDDGPVVLVGTAAPEGFDPVVRFDQGAIRLDSPAGQTILDSAAIARHTTVQFGDMGGRTLLWIRPGSGFDDIAQAAGPAVLGYGNVAFLDGNRIDFAFNSERERLIDIRYPDQFSVWQFFERYRLWIIGLGWLLLTLGFVYLLRRVLSSSRSDD